MTTEVQRVNNKTKKGKLKVKHQEEGNERNLEESEQIVENKKKSKKNKKKDKNNTVLQDVEGECKVENLENTEKVKGDKRQSEEDESSSKKKKLKKSKKNKDESNLSTVENKSLKSQEDNIEDEDEEGEEKPKKEPSKRQLKKEKAAVREAETKEAGKQGNAKKALNYVSMWKHAKSEWKFNKVVQAWLIHNLLDENYVPDDQYPTVLEYFEGCKGSARKQLIDKAMAVIKKVEEQVEKEEDEDEEIVETTEYKRARQLLQALPTET